MTEPESHPTPRKRRWPLVVLACLVVLAAVAVLAVWRAMPIVHRIGGQLNLRYGLYVLVGINAQDHEGLYPPLSPEPGRLMYPPEVVHPKYEPDSDSLAGLWTYPGTEKPAKFDEHGELNLDGLINDHSYFYLGYAITNDTEARAFSEAYKERIASGLGFEDDLKVPEGQGNAYGDTIHRLRKGVDKIIAEKQSPGDPSLVTSVIRIPVYIQRLGQCGPDKALVLFLHGDMEVMPYPGEFPMTPEFISVLEELDALGE